MTNAVPDNAPVLVGWAAATQRIADPLQAVEPLDLMIGATTAAARRSGSAALAGAVDRIHTPKGRWSYANPGESIARAIGAARARTILSTVGVLQQTLIGNACRSIQQGESEVALVVGGDCGYRLARAAANNIELPETEQLTTPDLVMSPAEELRHPAELRVGLRMPVGLYAIVHSAFEAGPGSDYTGLPHRISGLFSELSEVVTENPDSWVREPVSAEQIRKPGPKNRMQAYPYTRLHCSNWSVDQAGALIFCSAAKARELGIARGRWIHPLASSESNHMMQVSRRGELGRSPGARIAGERALASAGLSMGDIDLIDLYSAFPAAVEIFVVELGIPAGRRLTVTGGMSFAGGPYNNYVLQSSCRMADLLDANRPAAPDQRARRGLISCVSGVITKQAFGIWSNAPASEFAFSDVTDEVAREMQAREVSLDYEGAATVMGFTVLHERGRPPRAIVIANADNGSRVVAESESEGALAAVERGMAGAPVRIAAGQFFELA